MKLRSIVLASLLAASVASQPLQVSAQAVDDTEIEGFDSRKFVDYAGCALGIGFAAGTGAWLLAGLACYKAFSEHWTT
jgi:hypothetical protein